MSDFTNDFWNIYITVLTLLGIFGCGLLLWSQSKVKVSAESHGVTETTRRKSTRLNSSHIQKSRMPSSA